MNINVGDPIPTWSHGPVTAERMALMAAILRDPNPIHFEPVTESNGETNSRINQGPLNVGYIANMLIDWTGPASIKRLKVRFVANVFEGDYVEASGVVTATNSDDGEEVAECDVKLIRSGGDLVLTGTATVRVS
ncbi:MAG: MaoC/PaaZ C-terminal domain-containing protein [Acidimicrobiales bacterium]|nr:MaoC/PaaZ C-terminal domain-containing protein [Acidimicrobiales bacterium]